jgi:pimeloyl-ACP methyl ester carboxylesterase
MSSDSRTPCAARKRAVRSATTLARGVPGAANLKAMDHLPPLPSSVLPAGVRARFVDGVNGLRVHVLEAGHDTPDRPLLLLLHGFPELAYSWRRLLGPLAAAGYHVVAPDQRGYGRTTGWSDSYDQDLRPFSLLRLAADARILVHALGHDAAHAVIGHDFGSPVAAWAALTRPDVFRAVALMSAPFAGAPRLAPPGGTAPRPGWLAGPADALARGLAALPRPRKHYQWYYATREADADMRNAPQGIRNFLRAYFHHKSADWPGNTPFRLRDDSPEQLALMPTYYIMDLDRTMAETVAPFMPGRDTADACSWMRGDELDVYAGEFARTGFQGGLNWYRTRFAPEIAADFQLHAGRRIDVPALFVAGRSDWGVFQVPGALEAMRTSACGRFLGCHIVEGAGHWVMQEKPEAVLDALLAFLSAAKT